MIIVNDWDATERRKQERYSLECYLRVVDQATDSLLGHVVDISSGGMRLISEQPIPLQQDFLLWLEMSLESGHQGKVALEARSVWIAEDINPGLYDTGFCFMRLSPEALSSIDKLVYELSAD